MIHRLLDFCDLAKAVSREMHPTIHHLEDLPELQEVLELRRSQWICFEERHDDPAQMLPVPHVVDKKILAMVVVPTVAIDLSASEELFEEFQHSDASFTLYNRKAGLTLPTQRHHRISLDRTTEAALTVDEADDPLLDTWPFLLIVRTERIVTAIHVTNLRIRCDI